MSNHADRTGLWLGDHSDLLLELLFEEMRAQASGEEQRAFFGQIGRRLAAIFPLEAHGDVAMLERDANELFRRLGLGSARIAVTEGGLRISHDPGAASGATPWAAAMPAILEGVYDAWFRALGSGPRLMTTVLGQQGRIVELRHGL